jgi:hypothetical protein
MKKRWVEINHLLEGSMEHNWIIWSVRDGGILPRWVEIFVKSSYMHQDDQTKIPKNFNIWHD